MSFVGSMAVAALSLADPAPARAQANTVTTTGTMPLEFVTFSGCTGEAIQFSGEAHFVAHTTFDDTGGTHVVMHTTGTSTGLGLTSSDRYRSSGSHTSQTNASAAFEGTSLSASVLISQGPADNRILMTIVHFTVNANGEVTAEIDGGFVRCEG